MSVSPSLPFETWIAVRNLMLEAPVPGRVLLPVLQQFEAALQAARQAPATMEDASREIS